MASVRKQFRPAQLDLAERWIDLEDRADILERSDQEDIAERARNAALSLYARLQSSVNNQPLLDRLIVEMKAERAAVRERSDMLSQVSESEGATRFRDMMYEPLLTVFRCQNDWCGYLTEHDHLSQPMFDADRNALLYQCPNHHRFTSGEALSAGHKMIQQCPQCNRMSVFLGAACPECHRSVPSETEVSVVRCKECGTLVLWEEWEDHWTGRHAPKYMHIERSEIGW